MISLAAATMALRSPIVWLKVGAIAAVFAFGLGTGCRLQKGRDSERIGDLRVELVQASGSLRAASHALGEVSRRTRAAKAQADAAARENARAVAETRAANKALTLDLIAAEDALAAAKRADPGCRRQMETRSCAAFE